MFASNPDASRPLSVFRVRDWSPLSRQRLLWRVGIGTGFVVLYVLLDRSAVFFQMWQGISAWYPPAGLGLALLVGVDVSYAPLLLVAGMAAACVNYPLSPLSMDFWLINTIVAAGYSSAAYILRRVLRVDTAFRSLRDVNCFVATALAFSFLVGATGSAVFLWTHSLSWSDYPKAVLNWWVGDAVALICLTPFLLIHVTPWLQRKAGLRNDSAESEKPFGTSSLARRLHIESCAQAASILLSLWIVFGWKLVKSDALFYLFFPADTVDSGSTRTPRSHVCRRPAEFGSDDHAPAQCGGPAPAHTLADLDVDRFPHRTFCRNRDFRTPEGRAGIPGR